MPNRMNLFRETIQLMRRLKVRHRLGYFRVWCLSRIFPPPPRGHFPPVWMATRRPWGLLSIGGSLTPDTLLEAYAHGVYPLYDRHPVKWFSCNPRMVLNPGKMRIEKGWRRLIRSGRYNVTFDTAFEDVVHACSDRKWTWLIPERIDVAVSLFKQGRAHSVEVWNRDGLLVGGLFGVDMGRLFISESAFSAESNAMKVAYAYLNCHLEHWGYELNDAQAYADHLHLMGFEEIPRREYVHRLRHMVRSDIHCGAWTVDENIDVSSWIPSLP